jgi:putative endonuclease
VYYVYILELNDGSYYHGYSDDLKQRIKAHYSGTVASTKNFRPFKLVYYSAFLSKKKALDFEIYLKTQSGFAFRNKRLI